MLIEGTILFRHDRAKETSAGRWQSVYSVELRGKKIDVRNRADNISRYSVVEAKRIEPHFWHSINKMQTYVNVTRFLGYVESIYYPDPEFSVSVPFASFRSFSHLALSFDFDEHIHRMEIMRAIFFTFVEHFSSFILLHSFFLLLN